MLLPVLVLVIDTLIRPLAPLPGGVVDGYAATIRGDRFTYQSAHPTAHASLLVRSVDSSDAAVWQTAPVAAAPGARHVVFLAAMDVTDPGQSPVRFWLTVNGTHRLAIPQPTDTVADWSVPGANGITLHFHRLMIDRYGDTHGLFTLDLPAAIAPAGAPVTLRVQGESVGRKSWFIVYTVSMRPTVAAHAEQMLVRGNTGAMQTVRLDIWNPFDTATVMVSANGTPRDTVHLQRGATTYRLPVRAVTRPSRITIAVHGAGIDATLTSLPLDPVIRRDIYLINHNHLDIGYTDIQTAVRAKHERGLDSALAYIDRSRGNPPDARFRWNVEGLWHIDDYLATRPAADTARLLATARRGDLAFSALYANLMTGLSGGEELMHLVDFARTLREGDHVPVVAAMSSDVPGYTWGMVPALASQGIRYLSSGPNESDRIGNTLKAWGDRPFWWIGPSGQDSLLVMFAGHGYSWVYNWPASRITLADASVMSGYMDELAAQHYPWDIVQVRVAIGGDNGVPDGQLANVVRQWNARYLSPHLVIATLPEMFTAMERRYGKELPRIRGDLTGYWEDGAVSTLREEILARQSAARLVQATTLAALRGVPLAGATRDSAWQQVILWDEHTWGADRSISDPDAARTVAQWQFKQRFALNADSMSRALLARAARPRGETGSAPALDFWNTHAVPAHGIIRLDRSIVTPELEDSSMQSMVSQTLHDGSLAVAMSLPPLSHVRTFQLFAYTDGFTSFSDEAHAAGDSLWNNGVTVHIDHRTGAIASVRWRGHELVDTVRGGWGRYRYVLGRDTSKAADASNSRIEVLDNGPLVATLRITSDAPGARSLIRDVTVESGSDAISLVTDLDKTRVRENEAVHIGFPLAVPNGTVRMEQGWAIVRPDSDQAVGANRNLYPVQRWLDASNGEFGVTVVTPDLPLWELNGLTAEAFHQPDGRAEWLSHALPGTELIAYAMNNYWHTNFKADQPGPVTFRITLIPHLAFDAANVTHAALDITEPPLVVPASLTPEPDPPFAIDNDSIVVSSVTGSADGKAWMVRLWNPATRATHFVFRWRGGHPGLVWFSSTAEEHGTVARRRIEVPAMGMVTLRIEGPATATR